MRREQERNERLRQRNRLQDRQRNFGVVGTRGDEDVLGFMSAVTVCFPEKVDILTEELLTGEKGLRNVTPPPFRPDRTEREMLESLRQEREQRPVDED